MNVVDVLIVVASLASLAGGYRRGFWLSLAQYAGMLGGIAAGVYFGPDLIDRLGLVDPFVRQLAAILVIVVAASLGGTIGFWLLGPLRRWLRRTPVLGVLDSLGGATLSAGVTLVAAWLIAFTFARGPSPDLARGIQQSRIITQLDAVAPEPPAFIAKVQQVLSGTYLPPVFTGLEPDIPATGAPSAESARTAGVQAAAAATVKVTGTGCGGIATGSGFAVGDNLFVTNAHVVSGTSRTTLSTSEGRTRPATVVVFDPNVDLAILRATGLPVSPLLPADASADTRGAALGYPGGGPLRITPAVLQRRLTARGRDIFNGRIVEREVWMVSARVRPGNSGGPLVDEEGRYVGAIFASSVTDRDEAFALTADEIAPRIRQAAAADRAIDTSRFACSR